MDDDVTATFGDAAIPAAPQKAQTGGRYRLECMGMEAKLQGNYGRLAVRTRNSLDSVQME